MFCQKCGVELLDTTKFCVKCGHKLKSEPHISNKALVAVGIAALVSVGSATLSYWPGSSPTWTASTDSPSPGASVSPSPTPMPQITVVRATPKLRPTEAPDLEETTETAPTPTPQAYARAITQGPFTLNPGTYVFYQVRAISEASLRIEGWFEASGGSRNDIEVYILDEIGFTNFKNGNAARTYYNSGRATTGKPHVALPWDNQNYYVVFNNRFSLFSSKSVKAYMTAWYSDMRQR